MSGEVSPEVLALMRESFCSIPEGMRGCNPPVLCAVRRDCPADPEFKSWLVVRALDPCDRCPKGFGLVEWWPRASAWNCRSRTVWRGEGDGVVAQAWKIAATLAAEGPAQKYCLRTVRPKNAAPRDFQKNAVYKWEDSKLETFERPFSAEADAQAFVDAVCQIITRPGFHLHAKVTLKPRMRGARGGIMGISTSRRAMTPVLMLHELAHVVIERTYRIRSPHERVSAHGPEWLAWYLGLVVIALRPGQWEVLTASAQLAGLKVGGIPEALQSFIHARQSLPVAAKRS